MFALASPLAALVLTLSASMPSYDPIHAAGVIPPPGWTIRASEPGGLPAGTIGKADGGTKEILISADACFMAGEAHGTGTEGVIVMAQEFIYHEIYHVEHGDDMARLGFCNHMEAYEEDAARACNRSAEYDPGSPMAKMLCKWANDRIENILNYELERRNMLCSGGHSRTPKCPGC